LGVATVVFAACAGVTQPAAASVNGEEISAAEVTEALERFEKTEQFDQLVAQSDPSTARRQFEQAYLGQQIRRLVLRASAADLGIEVTDTQVSQRTDELEQSFGSKEAFDKAVRDRGITKAEVAELVRDGLIEEALRARVTAGSEPGEKELLRYYRSHRDSYEQTEVSHILVKKGPLAGRLSERLRAAPPSLLDALFARLARQHSTDPGSSRRGGELGWVSPGQLVEPFEKAMNELAIGEVSLPVPSEFGVHVIHVTGRRVQPFERVRAQITQQFAGQAEQEWAAWLRDAYRRADIEVNPRYGELDPATGQIRNASAADVPGAATPTPESG
jgi:foldase protein PrsA